MLHFRLCRGLLLYPVTAMPFSAHGLSTPEFAVYQTELTGIPDRTDADDALRQNPHGIPHTYGKCELKMAQPEILLA